MDRLFSDLRFGVRLLRRDIGFTFAAIVVLALGIGATTSIFSVVNGILFRPLPFPQSNRLVIICEDSPRVAGYCVASASNIQEWAASSQTLESAGVARSWPLHLRVGEEASGVAGGFAMGSYFQALGVRPELGRLFDADEIGTLDPNGSGIGPGAPQVAVLSHQLWMDRLGGDPDVLGRTIYIDEQPYTVVGVLPADARMPELDYVRLWLPFPFDLQDANTRSWRGFSAIGRMAPGADLDAVRSELATLQARTAAEYPEANEGWRVTADPLLDHLVGDVRPTLMLFLGAVGLVLLIACFNVANLLLVRSTLRDTEFAVRSAIGADRSRIMRQIFTESVVLALIAGGLGTLLAIWATDVFVSLAPAGIPRLDQVGMDGRVLSFAVLISLGTSFLFGLGPLIRQGRLDLRTILQSGRPGVAGRVAGRARRGLVVAEIGLAMVLLIGAGLLMRSFAGFLSWDPGFDADHLLAVSAFAPTNKYPTSASVAELWRRTEEDLSGLPGVLAVGTASAGPLFGGRETASFTIAGRPTPNPDEAPTVRWYDVAPGYFEAMGIPLVSGRWISESDVRDGPTVALVNQTMAERYWPDGSPVGAQVTLPRSGLTLQIIGIVHDVPSIVPGRQPDPEMYWSNRQLPRWASFIIVRTASEPGALVAPVRAGLKALDPDLDLGSFQTMEQLADRQLVRPRFNAALVGSFAAVALLLASVGLYGVISYTISTRAQEIGIRMALGADNRRIVRTVLWEGAYLVAAGVILGLAGAALASSVLAKLLFGVTALDAATYGATALLMAAIALAACAVPALRATRINPVDALRTE